MQLKDTRGWECIDGIIQSKWKKNVIHWSLACTWGNLQDSQEPGGKQVAIGEWKLVKKSILLHWKVLKIYWGHILGSGKAGKPFWKHCLAQCVLEKEAHYSPNCHIGYYMLRDKLGLSKLIHIYRVLKNASGRYCTGPSVQKHIHQDRKRIEEQRRYT